MTNRSHIWTRLATEADEEVSRSRVGSYDRRFNRTYSALCRQEAKEAERYEEAERQWRAEIMRMMERMVGDD